MKSASVAVSQKASTKAASRGKSPTKSGSSGRSRKRSLSNTRMGDILDASNAAHAVGSPSKKKEGPPKNGKKASPAKAKTKSTPKKGIPEAEPGPRVLGFSPKSRSSDDFSDGESHKKGRKRQLYRHTSASELGEIGEPTPEKVGQAKRPLARTRPVTSSQVSTKAKSITSGHGGSSAEFDDEDADDDEPVSKRSKATGSGSASAKSTPKRVKKVAQKALKAMAKQQERVIAKPPQGIPGDGAIRRTGRARTAPVEFWNHERPVYDEDGDLVDVKVDLEPTPKASTRKKPLKRTEGPAETKPKEPKAKPKLKPTEEKKKATPKTRKSRAAVIEEEEEEDDDDSGNLSDEGFVQDDDPMPVVRDRLSGQDVELRIVKSAAMLEFRDMEGGSREPGGASQIATAFGTSTWRSSVIVVPPASKTAVSESGNQLKT